jgi:choline dehydrogenase-like flavoprotein
MTPGIKRTDVERLLAIARSERVHDGAVIDRDLSDRAQVCVIGTGAGGAAIAYELVRRGHSVLLLEEGAYLTGRDSPGTPDARHALFLRERGDTGTSEDVRIPIPLGRCVGGTTAVGSGTYERAPDEVLHAWAQDEGVAGLGPAALAPYYERVERDHAVAPVPDAAFGVNNALLERGAAKLGWAGGRLSRGAPGCLGTGVCEYGCPQDAKQATHVSYVPGALAGGAQLYTRARAEKLLLSNGRVFGVVAELLDTAGRPSGRRLRVIAERVVVACGALLTPLFLERSGAGGRSGLLGKNLRIHPTVRVAARFDEEVRGWEEVPQAYRVRQFADEGIVVHGHFDPPSVTASRLVGFGAEHKRAMESFSRLGSFAARVTEEATGSVGAAKRSSLPRVRYRLGDADRRKMLRAVGVAAELCFAAGAVEVFPGLRARPSLTSADEARGVAASEAEVADLALTGCHPMGTARMGADASRGVTSPTGQVYGVGDLYVADASLFPTSCRADPQLTIMALALKLGEEMSAGLGAPL